MAATAEPEEWVRGEHSEDEDDGVQQVPLESEPHVTNHAKTVAVFKRLMADDKFADLVLVVGPTKQRMAAHKFVLMTRSTVLRSMLSGEWRETKAGEISLPEDSPEVWKELLAHAYTSKWSNAPSLLLDVKDYADRYGFGDLADDCGERISAMLSGEPENVMTMAAKAVAMANPVIRDLAFSSAFLNTATALRSEGILRLDRDALLTFVSDPRCATDEVDVFRAVVRWGLNQMAIAHAEGKGPSPIGRSKEDLEAAYSFLSHDIPGRAEAQEKCVGGGELEFEPAARGSSLAREARRRGKAFIPPHEMHSADVPDDASFLSLTDAQMAGLGPKLRAMRLRAKDTLQHSVVQTAEPADLREVLGEVLDAAVGVRGRGRLADNSDSVMTSAAWPNGGKGGYNYKTGSGGGSSLVTSELHDGKVLVGAGGGGGGTAAHSWSSGGGGGGGCKDGKMGQGGHGQMRTAEALRIGSDGGGNGGKDDSNGSGSAGESSHGAGGLSGSSTNANGGDGGEAFVLESAGVVLLSKINATSAGAVACDESGKSAGGGGGPGDCKRGSHGLVIIENSASGKRLKFEFSEKEPAVVCFEDFTRRPAKDSPRRQQGGGTLFDGLRSARVSKDVLELLNQHGAGIRVNDFGFLLSKLMQLEASPAGGRGSAAGKLSTDARRVMEVAARQLPALLRDAIAAPAKGGSARQHSKARFSALSNVIEAFHTAAGGDEEVLELAAAAAAESLAAGHPASVSRSASGLAAHGHLRGPFLAALASRVEAEAAAQLLARGASPPTPAAADEGDEASAAPAPRSPASPAAAAAGRSEEAAATAAKAALAALPAEPMDGFALLVTCTAAVGVLQRSPPSLAEDVAAAWRLVTAADEALPLLLPATQPRRRAANCVSAVDVVGRAIVGAPSPAEARALLSSSAVLSSDWVIRTEAFNAVAAELGGRIAEASRHAAASGAMTMDFASHLLFCAGRLPLPASQRRDLVATLKPVILKALKGAATGQAIDQRDVPRALAGLAQARADDSELTTALLRHFVNHSDDCTAVNALMVLQAVNTLVSPPAVLLEKAMHRADDVICLAARKDDSGLTPGFAASALVLLVSELGMVSSQAALSLVPVLRRTASSLTPELARDAQAAVLEVIRHRTKGGGAAGDRA
ncbi:hypothetical protein FNF28_02961 [Cafeteria roenbergensis]|uniref:BTB domain-containing protein n=1 Tax=Cafeteria roenbergensis TaxID=33653 RepID=A0A5A8DP52_CAFRO|nr:hypothetical protein FNF28_02961 [Cafeteria roenbergensis]